MEVEESTAYFFHANLKCELYSCLQFSPVSNYWKGEEEREHVDLNNNNNNNKSHGPNPLTPQILPKYEFWSTLSYVMSSR